MAKLSAAARIRNAVRQIDETQFELLRQAETYNDGTHNSHSRAAQRREFLRQARDYAAAVRRLAQVRS